MQKKSFVHQKGFAVKPGASLLFGLLIFFLGIGMTPFLGEAIGHLFDLGGFKGLNALLEQEALTTRERIALYCYLISTSLFMWAGAGLVWAIIWRRPFFQLGLKEKFDGRASVVAAICICVAIPFAHALSIQAEHFPDWGTFKEQIVQLEKESQQGLGLFLADGSLGALWMNLFAFALIPAIGEEIFFRGFLLQNIRIWLNDHAAVWITAFLFSALHFQFLGFFSRFFLGGLLGYFFLYTRDLKTSMLAHFFHNGLAIFLTWLALPKDTGELTSEESFSTGVIVTSFLLTVASFMLFYKIRKRKVLLSHD